jgi:hypothetical protein
MISPSRFDQFGSTDPKDQDVPPEVKTEHGIDPLAPLKKHLAELAEYVRLYLSTQGDSIRSSIRSAGIYAGLGLVAGIAGIALIAKATTMLLAGAAAGLGELFGERLWAGQLVVSAAVLIALATTIYVVMTKLTNTSRQKVLSKYEQRRQAERAQFGHDYRERAKSAGETDRSSVPPADRR